MPTYLHNRDDNIACSRQRARPAYSILPDLWLARLTCCRSASPAQPMGDLSVLHHNGCYAGREEKEQLGIFSRHAVRCSTDVRHQQSLGKRYLGVDLGQAWLEIYKPRQGCLPSFSSALHACWKISLSVTVIICTNNKLMPLREGGREQVLMMA